MASPLSKVNATDIAKELDFEYDEAFVNIVTVDVSEHAKVHFEKSVKKTLSLPSWLNTAALEKGINFSQVLQEALKEKLNVS